MEQVRARAIGPGIIAALVGFTSSAVVVLAGLRGVGASPTQAMSGLLAVCLTQGIGSIWLSRRHRVPVVLAWSTPGAALLAATGAVEGGWAAAVGAFLLVAVLLILTSAIRPLDRLVTSVPAPIAQAMLAGVLFTLCLAPVHGIVEYPWVLAPPAIVWVLLLRFAPRWAVPAAFVVAIAAIGIWLARHGGLHGPLLPHVELTAPSLTWPAVLSIAVPLYLVTMTAQNLPGAAVLTSYGYTPPWRESMLVTGAGTALGATAGGHAINLAAITAALAAGPQTHLEPAQRWRVADISGWTYVVLAFGSTALATVITSAPQEMAAAVAGLALLSALASSAASAVRDESARTAAIVTFVVAASGISLLGIGAVFWALIGGLIVYAVTRPKKSGDAAT